MDLFVVAWTLIEPLGVDRSLLADLAAIHEEQWRLEDVSREPHAPTGRVARAKRRIDDCNLRRHRQIDLIDAAITCADNGPPRRLYGETPGQLCDRLVIVGLRRDHLLSAARAPGTGDASIGDHLERVDVLAAHLAAYAEELGRDLLAGHAVCPPRAEVKLYGTGRATVDGQCLDAR